MNWKDKRVLITGAGGFIGSHLTERLVSEGAKVRAFLRYNCRGDVGNLKYLDAGRVKDIEIFFGDLRELQTVRESIKGIDIVFNLAALVGIPYSYEHPQEVVETNVLGTVNVLISAKDQGVQRVVQTSTSEVYGTAQYVPIDEKHPKQPQSPYAASKIAADALALSWFCSYGLPVAIIRPFNTYGPRQSDRAIIPAIIAQVLSNDKLSLGNLDPTRDFTFVADTVDAFMRMASCEQAIGTEVNIGSGREISIHELAKEIIGVVGKDMEIVQEDKRIRPQRSEVRQLMCDNTRARQILDWSPRTPLNEGLAATLRWVKSSLSDYRPGEYKV